MDLRSVIRKGETMKVWITKYALTQGVYTIEGQIDDQDLTVFCQDIEPDRYFTFYHKPFWHESEEAARAHFDKLKAARIASLKKSLRKTEMLEFKMIEVKP